MTLVSNHRSTIRFQFEHQIMPEVVSVTLMATAGIGGMIYYCSRCRMPVCKIHHQVMQELPGEVPSTIPIEIKCKNKECPRVYRFHVIVPRDEVL